MNTLELADIRHREETERDRYVTVWEGWNGAPDDMRPSFSDPMRDRRYVNRSTDPNSGGADSGQRTTAEHCVGLSADVVDAAAAGTTDADELAAIRTEQSMADLLSAPMPRARRHWQVVDSRTDPLGTGALTLARADAASPWTVIRSADLTEPKVLRKRARSAIARRIAEPVHETADDAKRSADKRKRRTWSELVSGAKTPTKRTLAERYETQRQAVALIALSRLWNVEPDGALID